MGRAKFAEIVLVALGKPTDLQNLGLITQRALDAIAYL